MAMISQRNELSGISSSPQNIRVLASGRGVLAMVPQDSEAARIVRGAQRGLVMESHDDEALANAIVELAANPNRVQEIGQNSFAEYESKYTFDSAIKTARKFWK